MSAMEAVKTLHTSMIDTERAYDKAQNETDDPALRAFFWDMMALRERSHDELHRVLLDMGQKPDESGSFMTTVHQTVIGLRAATVGIGRGALRAFIDGEEHILSEYDKALQQDDLYPETAALLRRQRASLAEKIAQMEDLSA